jgi:hypothetical protein
VTHKIEHKIKKNQFSARSIEICLFDKETRGALLGDNKQKKVVEISSDIGMEVTIL